MFCLYFDRIVGRQEVKWEREGGGGGGGSGKFNEPRLEPEMQSRYMINTLLYDKQCVLIV